MGYFFRSTHPKMLASNPIILKFFKSILHCFSVSIYSFTYIALNLLACLGFRVWHMSLVQEPYFVEKFYLESSSDLSKVTKNWDQHQNVFQEGIFATTPFLSFTFMGELNLVEGRKLFKAKSTELDEWSTQSNEVNIHWVPTVQGIHTSAVLDTRHFKAWDRNLN